jgi:hypothetical protein
MRRITSILVLCPALLGGCATLSESQCAGGDWFGIGEADALAGWTRDRLALHDQACAEYGIAPDPRGYEAGYSQGLVGFCVPAKTFALGLRGGNYYGQCPPTTEADLLPAFDLGREVHAIDQALIRIEVEIDRLRGEIEDEKTSPLTREAAAQQLDHVKDERDLRRYERDTLLASARARGYGNVW